MAEEAEPGKPGPIYCAKSECGAPVQIKGDDGQPFSDGPYKGGYWCQDCWIVYYDENPWHLADQPTKDWYAKEARRIRGEIDGAPEVIYREPGVVAELSSRGIVRIAIERAEGYSQDEFDPDRYRSLCRALRAVSSRLPEWCPDETPA